MSAWRHLCMCDMYQDLVHCLMRQLICILVEITRRLRWKWLHVLVYWEASLEPTLKGKQMDLD